MKSKWSALATFAVGLSTFLGIVFYPLAAVFDLFKLLMPFISNPSPNVPRGWVSFDFDLVCIAVGLFIAFRVKRSTLPWLITLGATCILTGVTGAQAMTIRYEMSSIRFAPALDQLGGELGLSYFAATLLFNGTVAVLIFLGWGQYCKRIHDANTKENTLQPDQPEIKKV